MAAAAHLYAHATPASAVVATNNKVTTGTTKFYAETSDAKESHGSGVGPRGVVAPLWSPMKSTAPPAIQNFVSAPPTPVPTETKKALLVGINYVGTPNELSGCVNDIHDMCQLCAGWGYTDICVLLDGAWPGPEPIPKLPAQLPGLSGRAPTRANIEAAMRWLTADAAKGGHRFFHYSGHGSQLRDQVGEGHDEPSGWDDTIIPVDFGTAGQIRDDELRALLVVPLAGTPVRLRAVLDCCHSGTGFDLHYTLYDVSRFGRRNFKTGKDEDEHIFVMRTAAAAPTRATADVLMISGCADFQTSDDAVFNGRANGALSRFLVDYLKGRYVVRAGEMLVTVREKLRNSAYDQVPQLSSEKPLTPDTLFDL